MVLMLKEMEGMDPWGEMAGELAASYGIHRRGARVGVLLVASASWGEKREKERLKGEKERILGEREREIKESLKRGEEIGEPRVQPNARPVSGLDPDAGLVPALDQERGRRE